MDNPMSQSSTQSQEILCNIARDVNLVKNSNYYKIDNNTAITRIFTGQKMVVDTRDLSLTPHVILDGEWEMKFTNIFRNLINETDNIIDIGSNIGWFATVGSTQNPRGRTLAIEANPDLVNLIQMTFIINGLNNRANVLNLALADQDGTLTLARYQNLWGSSMIMTPEREEKKEFVIDKKFEVQSTTLDSICKENNFEKVDVIKMDIEGFEQKAWNGMKNVVKNNPKLKLCLEFTPHNYENSKIFLTELFDKFRFRYFLDTEEKLTEIHQMNDIDNSVSTFGFVMLILSNSSVTS